MYKTFASIRSVEGNKWKLSYVFGDRSKLEKAVEKFLYIRGKGLHDQKIINDRDVPGYYCFECIFETREDAIDASEFLDNYLDEVESEDTYDYPVRDEDY
jgi:hypothetical protein